MPTEYDAKTGKITHTEVTIHKPLFTQRHYEKIAEVLKEQVGFCSDPSEFDRMEIVIYHLSEVFFADNSRFKRAQFMISCGLKAPAVKDA